ncbi:hypothetical protein [Pectobacterium versatile]|uniref:hypothetical protein n=1 Tax=Pectobacterium versatile TaxID=2488639 RepID=UPI000DAB3605|nr:hypothetical protein [Pectobacterium versatile]GBO47345.1 hypothetical protein MFFDBJGM_00339 [Pectobacterium versatile]
MKENFKKYKDYKENLSFSYKEYPVEKILSVEIASIAYGVKKFRLRMLWGFLSSRKIVFPYLKKNEVLYSMGDYHRKDYYDLLNYVRKHVPGNVIDLNKSKRTIKINLSNVITALKFIFKKGKGINFQDKIMLAISYTYIMNYIDDIEKNTNCLPGTYVSFCSSHINEAVIDLFFQRKSIPTFTLQHGLYFIFNNPPIDAISYENIISKKIFCWGEYTKKEFLRYGIPKEKLIVAGYPGLVKPLHLRDNEREEFRLLILLSRYAFHKNNIKILTMVSDLKEKISGMKVFVKMHPSLKKSDYKALFDNYLFIECENKTISSLLETSYFDMTVSYNSTAYYDSYLNNCVSLRYVDRDFDGSISVMDDSFNDSLTLLEKLEFFRNEMTLKSFWENVEERLEFIVGYKINNYKNEINNSMLN